MVSACGQGLDAPVILRQLFNPGIKGGFELVGHIEGCNSRHDSSRTDEFSPEIDCLAGRRATSARRVMGNVDYPPAIHRQSIGYCANGTATFFEFRSR
jgi:hypothetical protein